MNLYTVNFVAHLHTLSSTSHTLSAFSSSRLPNVLQTKAKVYF